MSASHSLGEGLKVNESLDTLKLARNPSKGIEVMLNAFYDNKALASLGITDSIGSFSPLYFSFSSVRYFVHSDVLEWIGSALSSRLTRTEFNTDYFP